MALWYVTLLYSIFLTLSANVLPFSEGKLIDLSHSFNNNTRVWATGTEYKHTVVWKGKLSDAIPYYTSYDISLAEHCGTHIDAPIHFADRKWSVDEIPPERLIGRPVIVVNISEKASKDRNALLTVGDLESWEKSNGVIPENCVLLVYTGWDSYYTDNKNYFGTDIKNASLYEFPGIDAAAARWLVANRAINGIGIDTASIDYGRSKDFQTHQILFKENIYGLENVANIGQLPATGAKVYVMPMKIEHGSGAPTRIFAEVQDGSYGSRNTACYSATWLVLVLGAHWMAKLCII